MLLRIISALILFPLLIFLYIGGIPLYILEGIIISCTLYELYKAFEHKGIKCIKIIGYIFSISIIFINYYNLDINITILLIFTLFLCSFIFVLIEKRTLIDLIATLFGLLYIGLFLNFIILTINNFVDGKIYTWLIFICSFSTDTFAYLSGKFLGKHKLGQKISPNKTIEGSLGGILGSIICCLVFSFLFNLNTYLVLLISIFGSIIAQLGDLFASSIKRYVGIKDFGNLIPGHGGILDRLDSILFVAPYIYYCIYIFNLLKI